MTYKLPEVGKIYGHRSYLGQECLIINITEDRVVYEVVKATSPTEGSVGSYAKSVAWKFLKEIPTPKEQTKEVEKAKDSLKRQIQDIHEWRAKGTNRSKNHLEEAISDLTYIGRRLTKALDSQKEEEIDIKTESVDSKEIWKPLSELPRENSFVLVKIDPQIDSTPSTLAVYEKGLFVDVINDKPLRRSCISGWMYRDDFVNQQQDLLSRVERLEQTINQNQK